MVQAFGNTFVSVLQKLPMASISSFSKQSFIQLAFFLLAGCFYFPSFCQIKADTTKVAKPLFTATVGIYSGTAKALNSDVKRLMTVNPVVKVKDSKGTEYKVVAFEVTWKRKEISEDLKSGKPKVVFYMVGADVKTNQLPDMLRQQISSNLQAGEEIMLTNILYTDPKKKINYKASNSITLTIL